MKRVLLVLASLLTGLTTSSATELNSPKPKIKLAKKEELSLHTTHNVYGT
ncbi:MAG: hypothetical protein P8I04_05150 [Algibacter sp.]|nr:hypothetical protein [Algibacter sp.]MDG1729245.1 hypothetical protein [Algibacter sp.]